MSGNCRTVVLILFAMFASATWIEADLIRLNNGGEIRGTVIRKAESQLDADVTILTLTGATIVVSRQDIEFVTPRSINIEQYESKLGDLPDTVDARWELAEWAREQKLPRQRAEQLEAILLLDPDHELAHKGLRHTFQNGKWMTRDEWMTSRGYIRHERRWVTQQELDLIQKTESERAAEQKWYQKIRVWLGWLEGRDADRQQEALRQLAALRDADVVPALRQFLGEHRNPEMRMMFVRILSQLPGSKPVRPLIERSLKDPEAQIRSESIAGLKPQYHEDAAALYIDALTNDLVIIVRRAALALRTVGNREAIDPLIDALVTQHKYNVSVQVQDPTYAVGGDGSIGFSGGTTLPPSVEGPLRTGQLPYGAVVIPPRGATRTKTVQVKRDERNPEVRQTLRTLTDQDFGYDERTWKLWWAAHESGFTDAAP